MMELFHRSMNQVRKSSIPIGQDRKKQGPGGGRQTVEMGAGSPSPVTGPEAHSTEVGTPGWQGALGNSD